MRPAIISDIPEVQKHYELCLKNGCAPKLAEMLAFGKAPRGKSDSTFMAGRWNQFADTPEIGDAYAEDARAVGVDPKGKIYLSSLAEFPGDPKAWVDSRDDVRRVCEERGWGCSGTVDVKHRNDLPPPPEVGVDPQLVEEHAANLAAKDPEAAAMPREELKEMVADRITPHWAK